MAIYSSPSISGYNSSPPSDDGSATSSNEITWAKHINKIGDPIKNYAAAIDSAVNTAFGKVLLNSVTAKTAAYTIATSDYGDLITCSGTFTVTLLAAASAGAGFNVAIQNNGTGVITIDGTTSETINGSTTITLNTGDSIFLISDASTWYGIYAPKDNSIRGTLVTRTTSQSIATGTPTSILWTNEVYDTDDIHNPSTNTDRLTVPSDVTYVRVSSLLHISGNATGTRAVQIQKNGTSYSGWTEVIDDGSANQNDILVFTAILPVTGGDYFTIVLSQGSGSSLNVETDSWATLEIIK